jgi:hypothetical protein
MAIVITPIKRVCDICNADITTGTGYQFTIPSVLIDNDGKEQAPLDSSQTDVCPECTTKRPADVVARLIAKVG